MTLFETFLNIQDFSHARAELSGHFPGPRNNAGFEVFAAILFDWPSCLSVDNRAVSKKSGNLLNVGLV